MYTFRNMLLLVQLAFDGRGDQRFHGCPGLCHLGVEAAPKISGDGRIVQAQFLRHLLLALQRNLCIDRSPLLGGNILNQGVMEMIDGVRHQVELGVARDEYRPAGKPLMLALNLIDGQAGTLKRLASCEDVNGPAVRLRNLADADANPQLQGMEASSEIEQNGWDMAERGQAFKLIPRGDGVLGDDKLLSEMQLGEGLELAVPFLAEVGDGARSADIGSDDRVKFSRRLGHALLISSALINWLVYYIVQVLFIAHLCTRY